MKLTDIDKKKDELKRDSHAATEESFKISSQLQGFTDETKEGDRQQLDTERNKSLQAIEEHNNLQQQVDKMKKEHCQQLHDEKAKNLQAYINQGDTDIEWNAYVNEMKLSDWNKSRSRSSTARNEKVP